MAFQTELILENNEKINQLKELIFVIYTVILHYMEESLPKSIYTSMPL